MARLSIEFPPSKLKSRSLSLDGQEASVAVAQAPTEDFAVSPSAEGGSALRKDSAFYEVVKRGIDVMLAALLLTLSLPVWCAAILLVRLTSSGPILFQQVRCGRNGKRFVCFKFRTMIAGAEHHRDELLGRNEMTGPVFKVKRDPRITWVGAVLRRTSVDELPQLFNVLAGDMSFVGPRPPLPSEVECYSDVQRLRLQVKPGLTCLWQVSGRNLLDFDRWMELDLEYVRRRSLAFDLQIIAKTVPAVLSGRGAV